MASREIKIVGDVVLRPAKPWTATVHSLLRHLHEADLPVPEPLSIDERGERVRLLRGDAGQECWPHQRQTVAVQSAGVLLRRMHDATVSWTPPVDAVWSVPHDVGQVICHGDVQPANMTWEDGRVTGLFDWDSARPADRIDDVAYALEWLAPFETDETELRRRGFKGQPRRRERIEAFLEGYGWSEPLDVVQAVMERQQRSIDEVVYLGERENEPHATWMKQGWPERWQSKLAVTRSLAAEFATQTSTGR